VTRLNLKVYDELTRMVAAPVRSLWRRQGERTITYVVRHVLASYVHGIETQNSFGKRAIEGQRSTGKKNRAANNGDLGGETSRLRTPITHSNKLLGR